MQVCTKNRIFNSMGLDKNLRKRGQQTLRNRARPFGGQSPAERRDNERSTGDTMERRPQVCMACNGAHRTHICGLRGRVLNSNNPSVASSERMTSYLGRQTDAPDVPQHVKPVGATPPPGGVGGGGGKGGGRGWLVYHCPVRRTCPVDRTGSPLSDFSILKNHS